MASHRIRRNTNPGTIVLLDTNALLMLFEFHIDLEGELSRLVGRYEIKIPKQVIDELHHIKEQGNGKKHQNAKAALQLCKRYEIIDKYPKIHGDEAILALASTESAYVLTNDKGLRARLQEKNIVTIFLRSKQRLALSS